MSSSIVMPGSSRAAVGHNETLVVSSGAEVFGSRGLTAANNALPGSSLHRGCSTPPQPRCRVRRQGRPKGCAPGATGPCRNGCEAVGRWSTGP